MKLDWMSILGEKEITSVMSVVGAELPSRSSVWTTHAAHGLTKYLTMASAGTLHDN